MYILERKRLRVQKVNLLHADSCLYINISLDISQSVNEISGLYQSLLKPHVNNIKKTYERPSTNLSSPFCIITCVIMKMKDGQN